MSAYPTLAPFVLKRPWLRNLLKPVASWYSNAAGYRQLGLRYENESPPPSNDVDDDKHKTTTLSPSPLPNCPIYHPPPVLEAFPAREARVPPLPAPACARPRLAAAS